MLLLGQGVREGGFHVPLWLVPACQAAMAARMRMGGWRILRSMGSRITPLTPEDRF